MSSEDQSGQGERQSAGDELDDYLSEMLHRTLGSEVAGANSSASIILPDQEDLTIRLVSQHSLERLRDAEQDKAVYDNLLWCLLGGMIGFFTNIITGGQHIDSTGYVFLACMASATGAVRIMRRRLVRRLVEARGRVHVGEE